MQALGLALYGFFASANDLPRILHNPARRKMNRELIGKVKAQPFCARMPGADGGLRARRLGSMGRRSRSGF